MVAAAMITSPFHIVAVSRDAGDVRWAEVGRSGRRRLEVRSRRLEVGGGGRTSRASHGDRHGAAQRVGLAYLAGPFSGAMILFAESTHPDVRFHAWQSIVGLGALGLLVIVSSALVFLSVFVSAAAVWVMVILTTVPLGRAADRLGAVPVEGAVGRALEAADRRGLCGAPSRSGHKALTHRFLLCGQPFMG
jgi:uncharacterized membrane protein